MILNWFPSYLILECYELDIIHFHFSLSCIGEGNGNPLQCFCLENPRVGVAWWAAVCGVSQSWMQLKWLSSVPVFRTTVVYLFFSWKYMCGLFSMLVVTLFLKVGKEDQGISDSIYILLSHPPFSATSNFHDTWYFQMLSFSGCHGYSDQLLVLPLLGYLVEASSMKFSSVTILAFALYFLLKLVPLNISCCYFSVSPSLLSV